MEKFVTPSPQPPALGLLGVQKTVVIKIQCLLALQLLILQAYLRFNQKFLTEFEYRTFIKERVLADCIHAKTGIALLAPSTPQHISQQLLPFQRAHQRTVPKAHIKMVELHPTFRGPVLALTLSDDFPLTLSGTFSSFFRLIIYRKPELKIALAFNLS